MRVFIYSFISSRIYTNFPGLDLIYHMNAFIKMDCFLSIWVESDCVNKIRFLNEWIPSTCLPAWTNWTLISEYLVLIYERPRSSISTLYDTLRSMFYIWHGERNEEKHTTWIYYKVHVHTWLLASCIHAGVFWANQPFERCSMSCLGALVAKYQERWSIQFRTDSRRSLVQSKNHANLVSNPGDDSSDDNITTGVHFICY